MPCMLCAPQLAVYPLQTPGHANIGSCGDVPAGAGSPAHRHVHSHGSQCDYKCGATEWALSVHQPLCAVAAKYRSSRRVSPAASSARGAANTIIHRLAVCHIPQSLSPGGDPEGCNAGRKFYPIYCLHSPFQGLRHIMWVHRPEPDPITSEPPPWRLKAKRAICIDVRDMHTL